MYKYLVAFALLLITFNSVGQNKAVIKGRIIDSTDNSPAELVTIALLTVKDTTSSLVSYTITDKKGEFKLQNLPADVSLKLFISSVAYKPYRKFITLKKGQELDLGDITLGPNQLNQVTIKGERPPIVIRKDTIEFNTEAFKTRPNAVVEDLLKKLPGMQVEMNGKITVQGKDVSKVLVDGHEFFGNDYRIATKNIDVDMVDKIQVYDDREDDPLHLKRPSQLDKIINIKFKKALKKSTFGKLYGGMGTQGRYTAAGLLNKFRDTLQISLLGIANNLNNTGFSNDDLENGAGFNRGGGDAFGRGGMRYGDESSLGNISSGGGNGGFVGFNGTDRQKTASGGININTDYGKKLKINLAYYYSHTDVATNMTYNSSRFLNDTTINSKSSSASSQLDVRHNITSLVQWKPNDTTELNYRPSFSYADSRNEYTSTGSSFSNFISTISNSNNQSLSTTRWMEFQHALRYSHNLHKQGESISISHQISLSPNNGKNFSIDSLTSYTAALAPYLQNRYNATAGNSTFLNIDATYRYPLSKKLAVSLRAASEYNHNKNYTLVYDYNNATRQYDAFLPLMSNTFIRNAWRQNLQPNLIYDFTADIGFTVSANMQALKVNNQYGRNLADINQNFNRALPAADFHWHGLSLSYSTEINTPDIDQLKPYTIINNPQYSESGNPDLKPSTKSTYGASYNKYFEKKQLTLYGSVSYYTEDNAIFRHQTQNAVGYTTSTLVNMNGRFGLTAFLAADKTFDLGDESTLRSATRLTTNRNRSYFEINNQGGFQHNENYALTQKFSFDWKDIIQFEQEYRLSTITTKYTGVTYNDLHYITHVVNNHLILTLPKVFTLESTYAYVYNPRVAAGMRRSSNLLNLSLAHRFLKKERAEVKLSCYDILNQNVSQYRFTDANMVSDVQWQTLNRYFLVTLQFKFNKTVTK